MEVYQDYYSLGDVARILGVPQHRIVYLLQSGQARESMRLGGRRAFTFDDLFHIAQLLQSEKMAELRAMQARGQMPKESDRGTPNRGV
jgi:DNA-binding transcriptional MerR regulator